MTMIPPIPIESTVMMPTPKNKINFSIESIVGGNDVSNPSSPSAPNTSQQFNTLYQHPSPYQYMKNKSDANSNIQELFNRIHHNVASAAIQNNAILNSSYSPPHTRLSPDDRERSPLDLHPMRHNQPVNTPPESPPSSRTSPVAHQPQQQQPQHQSPQQAHQQALQQAHQHQQKLIPPPPYSKGPIMVPGMPPANLMRPYPIGASAQQPPQPQMPDIKPLPAFINPSPEMQVPPPPHGLLAHFQVAAAIHANQMLGPAAAAVAAGLQPHPNFFPNPNAMPRESYTLHPWLMSRHGRFITHRFPGMQSVAPFAHPSVRYFEKTPPGSPYARPIFRYFNQTPPGAPFAHPAVKYFSQTPPCAQFAYPTVRYCEQTPPLIGHNNSPNFLLQPFRKPKRIRTAFSPSQLLKLEHAFESNQYVVGAERKALAQSLNLSETQVKVWFQNRRTKHKRMQQEDDKSGNGQGNSSSDRNQRNNGCDEEDEEIDMEMDDCPSDDEHDDSHQ